MTTNAPPALDTPTLARLQRRYLIGMAAIAPVSPLLYALGQYTRLRVGVLPDAAGPDRGVAGAGTNGEAPTKLLVLGESTVAGLGARTHELALAGQFARRLSAAISRPVEWHVIGRSGVTARRTIDELVPLVPADEEFAHILLGLGGNDVLRLSSPVKWRRDMLELIGILRRHSPRATVFMTNCPMVRLSPAIPQPLRAILWELSKMHDANAREFTAALPHVHYYPQPRDFNSQGFFADGIHPSEQGYADWAEAMMRHFGAIEEW
ncbi:MAG: SGNH/GDSL hydrolase family protein [Pyrinomonadaceae bacterium]